MISFFIVERLGFERKVLTELAPGVQTRLTLEASLSLISCLLFGISGAYVAYLETYARFYAWPMAIAIGVGVFFFALNIQRLYITAGGFGISRPLREKALGSPSGETFRTDAIAYWRPDQLRLFCTFLLAVVFSQPLLLLSHSISLGRNLDGVIDAQVAAFSQDYTSRVMSERAALVINQHTSLEKLNQSGFDVRVLGADPIPAPPEKPALDSGSPDTESATPQPAPAAEVVSAAVASRPHKALVIGVQKYLYAQSLNNPTRDADDMTRVLKELGYQVATLKNDKTSSSSLRIEIDRYIKSLEPGDVSVFYFSGHGYMHRGSNFLAAADAGGPGAIDINLMQVIEDISKRSPRASIVLLDACSSWPKGADQSGLGHLNGDIKGTLVAYAASPGQAALDLQKGQNGLFTQKLLKNLRNPENISLIMIKVRKEVVEYAQRSNHPQTPYVLDALMDVVSFGSRQSPAAPTLAAATTTPPAKANELTLTESESSKNECSTGNVHDVPCLLAQMELGATRIARLDEVLVERLPGVVKNHREFLVQSGHLADRFRMQWLDPLESALASVAFVLLLWAGDLIRDLKPFALRHYERVRYQQARRLVRNNHEEHSRITQTMLEKFDSYRLDTRERIPLWDADEGFFYEKDIRRPDHRALYGDIEAGSVLDLIEELRGAPAAT